jgi:hypothetical protein
VAYARRRHRLSGGGSGRSCTTTSVFVGRVEGPPETWPQRTALERAIVAHLRAGREWQTRAGVSE